MTTNYSIHKLQPANHRLTEQLRAYAYDVIGCEESRVPANFQFVGRGGSATITFVASQLNHGSPLPTKYMYQEALAIALTEANIPFQREYSTPTDTNQCNVCGCKSGNIRVLTTKTGFWYTYEDSSRDRPRTYRPLRES